MKIKLALLAALLAPSVWAAPDFDSWAENLAAERMRDDPLTAPWMQYFKGEEQAQLDGRLASIAKSARLKDIERERKALAELRSYDPKTLSPQQRVSASLIRWSLEQDILAGNHLDQKFIFEQMTAGTTAARRSRTVTTPASRRCCPSRQPPTPRLKVGSARRTSSTSPVTMNINAQLVSVRHTGSRERRTACRYVATGPARAHNVRSRPPIRRYRRPV